MTDEVWNEDEHEVSVTKGEAFPNGGDSVAWFTPVCSCGWQGLVQKQSSTSDLVARISSYDNAWLTAGAEAQAHKRGERR